MISNVVQNQPVQGVTPAPAQTTSVKSAPAPAPAPGGDKVTISRDARAQIARVTENNSPEKVLNKDLTRAGKAMDDISARISNAALSPLGQDQMKEVEVLYNQMDEILKDKGPGAQMMVKAIEAEYQINKALNTEGLEESARTVLMDLGAVSNAPMGEVNLSPEEEKKLNQIFDKLGKIYDKQTLDAGKLDQAALTKEAGALNDALSDLSVRAANTYMERMNANTIKAGAAFTKADIKAMEEIYGHMEELLKDKGPQAELMVKSIETGYQLGKVMALDGLNVETRKALEDLDKVKDKPIGEPLKLSQDEEKKLSEMFTRLEKIFDRQAVSLDKLDQTALAKDARGLSKLFIS